MQLLARHRPRDDRAGRRRRGTLFERLLSLRNDLGLFSEEYDQEHRRLIGNFPQAFTHLTLIASAVALSEAAEGRGHQANTGR